MSSKRQLITENMDIFENLLTYNSIHKTLNTFLKKINIFFILRHLFNILSGIIKII